MSQPAILLRNLGALAPLIFGYSTVSQPAAAQGAPQDPESAQLTAGGSAGALEEIIVTARKREESLQQVPISIAAVSGEELERQSIESLEDLGQMTPNFHFSEQPNGGRLGGVAFIRGVGQRDANAAYDPSVGIYVDGIYMGRAYGSNLDLNDVQRVEVLRGPQGTLFGKNTSGGAISIVTEQPDTAADAWSGRLQVTSGSRDRLDFLGNVNVPIVADRLALRISGSRLKQDGYGHRADGQDMADTNRTFARAQLLFQPVETFSALLAADWLDFDERNASYKLIDTDPSIGPLGSLNNVIDPDYDDRWVSPRDYVFNATGPNSARGRIAGTSLTLTKKSDWGTFKSISGYRQMDIHNDADTDGAPITIVDKLERIDQQQFSQELQASGSAFEDRLDWLVGAYYFHEEISNPNTFPVLTALFGNAISFTRMYEIENDSIAGFAQGTYSLTDRLRLTAGLRYTQDDKHIDVLRIPYPTGPVTFALTGKHSSDSVSPRIGLDYQWTPNVMTYVSAAQGAKNGGFNGQVARPSDFDDFDDETVWTHEVGLRTDLWDGRVRFNATAFFSDYSDLQLQINGATVVNGAPTPFNVITNIPEATIRGGEIELAFAPMRGLLLLGGLGLTYGKYTQLPTDSEFVASRVITSDTNFSHMPETTFTVGAQYTTAVFSGVDMTARADYAHKSRIYYNTENTANAIQPAYGLLNARLTFEHADSGISVSLFGTNLTDEAYIVGAFDDVAKPNPGLGFAVVTQGAPREYGISAQIRF